VVTTRAVHALVAPASPMAVAQALPHAPKAPAALHLVATPPPTKPAAQDQLLVVTTVHRAPVPMATPPPMAATQAATVELPPVAAVIMAPRAIATPVARAVDGYNTTAEIARGEGYQRAFADLAAQKGVHLSNEQSWALYQHLATQFHGNFFTDNPSYNMGHGNYGIGSAKTSHWDPRVVHAMNQWMLQNSNESEHAQFN
jgi:hypothetical protein